MCVDCSFKGAFLTLLFFPGNNRYKVLHCMAKKNPPKVYSDFGGYVIMFGFVYFFFPYFLEI